MKSRKTPKSLVNTDFLSNIFSLKFFKNNGLTTCLTTYGKTEKKSIFYILRDVAQLVARVLWEHDVAGSNPVIPTKNQPKTSFFRLVFGYFLSILHKSSFFLDHIKPLFSGLFEEKYTHKNEGFENFSRILFFFAYCTAKFEG